jgi:hypothetical protein
VKVASVCFLCRTESRLSLQTRWNRFRRFAYELLTSLMEMDDLEIYYINYL